MSFGMMVTRLAWMAHKLVSSKRPTRYASDASWSANTAVLWNRKSVLKSCAISRTRRWNGSLRIKSSVDFWYLLRHRNVRFITHSSVTHPSSVVRRPSRVLREISLILGLTRASRLDTHRISRSATVPGRYLCGFFTPANARAKLSRVSLRPPSRSRRPASRRQIGSSFPRHPRANDNE